MAKREVGFVVTDEYKSWIEEIKSKIQSSQIKASVKVNYEMLDLYWQIGKDITEKQKYSKWMKRVFCRKFETYEVLV